MAGMTDASRERRFWYIYCTKFRGREVPLKNFATLPEIMNIYLYAVNDTPRVEKLAASIGPIAGAQVIRLGEDFTFDRCHNRGMRNDDIFVLVLDGVAELKRFLNNKELLADFRLVILLADNSQQMAVQAHALMPRFISHLDRDIDEIICVFERMIRFCGRSER
jgi:hypothetical protein